MEHGPSHGRRGVKAFRHRNEFYPVRLQHVPKLAEVGNGTREAVETVDVELADLVGLDVTEQPLKVGTVRVLSGVALIAVRYQRWIAGGLRTQVELSLDGKAVLLFDGLTRVSSFISHLTRSLSQQPFSAALRSGQCRRGERL